MQRYLASMEGAALLVFDSAGAISLSSQSPGVNSKCIPKIPLAWQMQNSSLQRMP